MDQINSNSSEDSGLIIQVAQVKDFNSLVRALQGPMSSDDYDDLIELISINFGCTDAFIEALKERYPHVSEE